MRTPEAVWPSEDLKIVRDNFICELDSAYSAYVEGIENRTSLPFIPNMLPSKPLVEEGEVFTALVFGGTLGTRAVCRKTPSGIEIVQQDSQVQLPKLAQGREFFQYVDSQLVSSPTRVVAVNFAYPIEPVFEQGFLDGRLLDVDETNAVSARDLIGANIGQEISNYILSKRNKSIKVSVGNDGVCLLLSGKTVAPENNLAFSVIGTGLNAGFMLDATTAINLESSGFDKFPQTEVGKELTKMLGYPFGKEINGACLYRHYNAEIQKKGLKYPLLQSTRQLSETSQSADQIASQIAQKHLDRSAQLIACQTAAIAEFKNQDMIFVMEGSLFWKGSGYKDKVEETVVRLTDKKIAFVEIPNSGVIGASKLVA